MTQSLSADFTPKFLKDKQANLQELYQICLSGSLLNRAHLEEISRAVRTYLTPGQTFDTVNDCLRCLQDVWDEFMVERQNGDTMNYEEMFMLLNGHNQKNQNDRKWGNTDDVLKNQQNLAALSFAFNARIVAAVLLSLPFGTMSENVRIAVLSKISDRYVLFSDQTVTTLASDIPSWPEQIIAAATLHIGHALYTCPALRSLDIMRYEVISNHRLDALVNMIQIIPDLAVEMVFYALIIILLDFV